MKNMASELGHIDTAINIVTPMFDHGQTPVIQPCDTCMTTITLAQTQDTPSTHTGLSYKQAHVLDVLINNSARITNYSSIGVAVGISKSAARSAVNQLVKKKYISEPITVRDGVFQGFSYWIDNVRCQEFCRSGGASNEKYLSSSNTLTPPIHTVCFPSDPPHTLSRRSCLDIKLTTQTVDLNEPELFWWSDQGLTKKQITSWIIELRIKPEELAQSLRFARFDAVMNEITPNGKPIENALNWLYVVLKKVGAYPRPKNYKSIIEQRADQLEEQVRQDKIARDKIKELELDIKFNDFLKNPESPLYQELYNNLHEFIKNDPFQREIAFKELYKERYEIIISGDKRPNNAQEALSGQILS